MKSESEEFAKDKNHVGRVRKRISLIRVLILAAAVIFIACGLYRGEDFDVKIRAVMICLECIGIG